MNNKVLALLAGAPIFLAFLSGVFSAETASSDTFFGLWIMIFGTWALIRLYKFPEVIK